MNVAERAGERGRKRGEPASSVSQPDNASAQASGNVTISFLKSSVRVFTVPPGIDRGYLLKGNLWPLESRNEFRLYTARNYYYESRNIHLLTLLLLHPLLLPPSTSQFISPLTEISALGE